MKVDLKDRVTLVIGASRGIGKSISAALASNRARVVFSLRSKKILEAVKGEIGRAPGA